MLENLGISGFFLFFYIKLVDQTCVLWYNKLYQMVGFNIKKGTIIHIWLDTDK